MEVPVTAFMLSTAAAAMITVSIVDLFLHIEDEIGLQHTLCMSVAGLCMCVLSVGCWVCMYVVCVYTFMYQTRLYTGDGDTHPQIYSWREKRGVGWGRKLVISGVRFRQCHA